MLCKDLEGWDGGGGVGRGHRRAGMSVYLQLIHIVVQQNQHNIVKQLSSSSK